MAAPSRSRNAPIAAAALGLVCALARVAVAAPPPAPAPPPSSTTAVAPAATSPSSTSPPPSPLSTAAPPAALGAAPLASAALPGPAAAAAPTGRPAHARTAAAPRRPVEVRIALSGGAAENLAEPRLRRLLEIELAESAIVAPSAAGPLDEHAAYVWIERPTAARLEIQVRLDARPVVRRSIAISGLTSDVAARLVAIAASELIRAEVQRQRAPRRPPPPRRPSPEELERAARDRDAIALGAGPYAAYLPAASTLLAGPSLGVGLRHLRVTEALFARWLGAPLDNGSLRWLEAGISVDYRLWASPTWRFSLGASAALASLRVRGLSATDGAATDGAPHQAHTWSARGGAALGVEARVGGPVWLGLQLEPGAILRPAPYPSSAGASGAVEGAWLGLALTLSVEGVEGVAAPP